LWRVVIPSYTGGASVQGAPALYDDLAIFTGTGGRAWAVDRSTAALAWQFIPPSARYATVTQAELFADFVYVDGGDERTYALRAADGGVAWSADGGATRDLLVTDRRVYVPSGAVIRILDRSSGQLVATATARSVGDAVQTPPAFLAGQVFVGLTPAAWSFDEP
jgi:outer membrane protein assembly factor BamB